MDLDGRKIFGILLLIFVITLGIAFDNLSLKTENAQLKDYNYKLLTARTECSPLGICIGDKVEPTDDAKRWNITIGGVVRKIEGKVLTINTDTPENEELQVVDEVWVKHDTTNDTTNFSFRQGIERAIKTQYAPSRLQFKEIVCDRVAYDDNCYVRYDIAIGGYWITIPKKYANEW